MHVFPFHVSVKKGLKKFHADRNSVLSKVAYHYATLCVYSDLVLTIKYKSEVSSLCMKGHGLDTPLLFYLDVLENICKLNFNASL